MRGRFTAAALAAVLASASGVALLAVSGWLVVRASEQPPVLHLMVAIVAVRALSLTRAVGRYAERLAAHDVAFRRLGELRGAVYARLERIAPAGVSAYRSGDLLARLVGDVDATLDRTVRVRLPVLAAVVTAAAACAGVLLLHAPSGLALLAAVLVSVLVVPVVVRATGRRAEQAVAPARGRLAAEVTDLLHAAPDLVALGATATGLAAVAAADADLGRAERRSAWSSGLGGGLVLLALGAALWVAVDTGVEAVGTGGLAAVALGVVALVPLALADVLLPVPAAAAVAERVGASERRLAAVLDAPEPVREPAVPLTVPPGPYALSIRGLRARWSPTSPWVLSGIDLEVAAGARVVVLGRSGAGKSTLAQVLVRLLEPDAGSVRLGGADITRLDGDDVRRVVGLCAQDAYVFDTTIAENVRLARPGATDDEVRAALDAARLGPWLDSLPRGLQTRVGENGAQASGGERQRLALARVLLADKPVVVLDEPTEHVDEPTARALVADLLAATAGRTVLLLTHRTDCGGLVDETYDLVDGRLERRETGVDDEVGILARPPCTS